MLPRFIVAAIIVFGELDMRAMQFCGALDLERRDKGPVRVLLHMSCEPEPSC